MFVSGYQYFQAAYTPQKGSAPKDVQHAVLTGSALGLALCAATLFGSLLGISLLA